MRNEEFYKTPKERYDAFGRFCHQDCDNCKFNTKPLDECTFCWLADEYKEPDLPFKVDYGTSIVAIRRADTREVIYEKDHTVHRDWAIEHVEKMCNDLNAAALAWHKRMVEKGE